MEVLASRFKKDGGFSIGHPNWMFHLNPNCAMEMRRIIKLFPINEKQLQKLLSAAEHQPNKFIFLELL